MGKKTKPISKKVLINVKILLGEKNALKAQANKYSRGNVTKLIRLLAHGKFIPNPKKAQPAKKAA